MRSPNQKIEGEAFGVVFERKIIEETRKYLTVDDRSKLIDKIFSVFDIFKPFLHWSNGRFERNGM